MQYGLKYGFKTDLVEKVKVENMINQKTIREARKLYLERGSLRRNDIREIITYSWVRSRLLGLKGNEKPIPSFSKSIIPDQVKKKLHILNDQNPGVQFVLCDQKGRVVYHANTAVPTTNFSEDMIGTNGIGLAAIDGKNRHVVGHEHYNDHLADYTTVGLVAIDAFNGFLLGCILSVGYENFDLAELEQWVINTLSVSPDLSNTLGRWPVSNKDHQSNETSQSVERQQTIHSSQSRAVEPAESNPIPVESPTQPRLVYLADPLDLVLDAAWKSHGTEIRGFFYVDFKRVSYNQFFIQWFEERLIEAYEREHKFTMTCVNMGHFTGESTSHIDLIEDCKRVYRKLAKASESKALDVSIFIKSDNELTNKELTGLQTSLHQLTEKRDRLESSVKQEKEQVSQNETLDIGGDDSPLIDSEVYCLRTLEEQAIERAIQVSNGNLVQAAKLLEISRSTLYRKLDKMSQ